MMPAYESANSAGLHRKFDGLPYNQNIRRDATQV